MNVRYIDMTYETYKGFSKCQVKVKLRQVKLHAKFQVNFHAKFHFFMNTKKLKKKIQNLVLTKLIISRGKHFFNCKKYLWKKNTYKYVKILCQCDPCFLKKIEDQIS